MAAGEILLFSCACGILKRMPSTPELAGKPQPCPQCGLQMSPLSDVSVEQVDWLPDSVEAVNSQAVEAHPEAGGFHSAEYGWIAGFLSAGSVTAMVWSTFVLWTHPEKFRETARELSLAWLVLFSSGLVLLLASVLRGVVARLTLWLMWPLGLACGIAFQIRTQTPVQDYLMLILALLCCREMLIPLADKRMHRQLLKAIGVGSSRDS